MTNLFRLTASFFTKCNSYYVPSTLYYSITIYSISIPTILTIVRIVCNRCMYTITINEFILC